MVVVDSGGWLLLLLVVVVDSGGWLLLLVVVVGGCC